MIIDHDLKLVVLHVPKCAGTALRHAFLEDGAERRMESWFDFSYDPVLKRQVDLAHRPLMDLRHTKLWRWLRRYQVIACIRHPTTVWPPPAGNTCAKKAAPPKCRCAANHPPMNSFWLI